VVLGGWVTVMTVVVSTGGVVEVVTTGADSVCEKLVVQSLFEVAVTVLTLHQ